MAYPICPIKFHCPPGIHPFLLVKKDLNSDGSSTTLGSNTSYPSKATTASYSISGFCSSDSFSHHIITLHSEPPKPIESNSDTAPSTNLEISDSDKRVKSPSPDLAPDLDLIQRSKDQSMKFNPSDFDLPALPDDLKLDLDPPYFSPKRGLFFTTNEDNQEETFEKLSSTPLIRNGAYLGFSTWINFSFIALRKPQIAFICDLDVKAFEYFRIIKKCVEIAPNPFMFIQFFFKELDQSGLLQIRINENGRREHHNVYTKKLEIDDSPTIFEYFLNELTNPNSWLADQTKYDFIKSLYRDKKIFHLSLNAADNRGNFEILSKWLQEKNLILDTLYVSNIGSWIQNEEGKRQFSENKEKIITKSTIVIRSDYYASEELKKIKKLLVKKKYIKPFPYSDYKSKKYQVKILQEEKKAALGLVKCRIITIKVLLDELKFQEDKPFEESEIIEILRESIKYYKGKSYELTPNNGKTSKNFDEDLLSYLKDETKSHKPFENRKELIDFLKEKISLKKLEIEEQKKEVSEFIEKVKIIYKDVSKQKAQHKRNKREISRQKKNVLYQEVKIGKY